MRSTATIGPQLDMITYIHNSEPHVQRNNYDQIEIAFCIRLTFNSKLALNIYHVVTSSTVILVLQGMNMHGIDNKLLIADMKIVSFQHADTIVELLHEPIAAHNDGPVKHIIKAELRT